MESERVRERERVKALIRKRHLCYLTYKEFANSITVTDLKYIRIIWML